ncbi:MAG TPA: restriction endonuclease [Methanocellales archaeon]|nr:restriction endonuclease [Methanocellales archaeon]
MDFIDYIREISVRIQKQANGIQTEEATKNAFIMPFIGALGYNVFDPTEVTPELVADVGTKKGEKVDYAILINGKPIILFECKWCGTNLDNEDASQLYRYFSVTEARFGVLTNGVIYRFFSDLENQNIMDAKPFLELNMLDLKEPIVDEVKKFSKSSFQLDAILATASDLKYMREIRRIIEEQINEPSEDFVKFFASQVYSGKLTQPVREQFAQITKKTFKQFINDKINERLSIALASEAATSQTKDQTQSDSSKMGSDMEEVKDPRIITTDEERDGYYIIRTILRGVIDVDRISIRDTINYCGVVIDGSPRKTVARLYFNSAEKTIGIIDEQKNEEKFPLSSIDEIYKYEDKLKTIASYYSTQKSQDLGGKSLTSFCLRGKRFETKYWKDMMLQISKLMAEEHEEKFDSVLTIAGRKRPFFSKNPEDLRSPEQIDGTDIYAETNLSSYSMMRLSKNLLSLFGYQESDLTMEIQ